MISVTGEEIEKRVEAFYREHPFPDFDLGKYNAPEDLESRASWYFKLLDTYIPENASVIEIGCGTGQLVNFLALKPERRILGMDLSEASLGKAGALRNKLGLENLELRQASLFNIAEEIGETFPYVFCNGVLHHTHDPERAFRSILDVVPPGGFLVVGYYNGLARIPLKFIRARIDRNRDYDLAQKRAYLEKLFTIDGYDDQQIASWFADQFLHPRETTVSLGRALKWFRESGIRYINSFPPIEIGRDLKNAHLPRLQPNPFLPSHQAAWKRSSIALLLKQIAWMLQPCNEGGYFSLIGQRV